MVSSQRFGLIKVEHLEGLFRKNQCLTAAVINHVNPGQLLKVLIENVTKKPVELNTILVVTTTDYHGGRKNYARRNAWINYYYVTQE